MIDRQSDRQTGRQTGRQTDKHRQTDTDRQTQIDTDRQIDRQILVLIYFRFTEVPMPAPGSMQDDGLTAVYRI